MKKRGICPVCDDGTRVQGAFVIGFGNASGSGHATDTNGNVCKLLFQLSSPLPLSVLHLPASQSEGRA